MTEPGTPKPYEKTNNIEQIAAILAKSIPGVFDVLFSDIETGTNQNKVVISSKEGEGSFVLQNSETIFPIKIVVEQLVHKRISAYLRVGDSFDNISLYIQFESDDETFVYVTSLIKRSKPVVESVFPKGTGIEIYKIIPRFISALAKTNAREYKHEIERSENYSLSKESWHATFDDFLKENGYTYIEGRDVDVWTKSYR